MKKIKILAFFIAIITAGALFWYMSQLGQNEVQIARANVLVASSSIMENTVITAEMVKTVVMPIESIISDSYSDDSYVIGKTARSDIMAEEQIVSARLVEVGSAQSGSLAYAVKPGMRAITIGVNDTTGLKGMIRPGDYLDIVALYQVEQTNINAQGLEEVKLVPMAKLLLQKIMVLAIDQSMQEKETVNYSTLTLEVTPEQAIMLSLSEYNGLLKAILRSPVDEEDASVQAMTLTDITG